MPYAEPKRTPSPDPWHLFHIEVTDDDGTRAFVLSAQSGSEGKAQELAEAAVLTYESVGEGAAVSYCTRLGTTDSDIMVCFGLLVEA